MINKVLDFLEDHSAIIGMIIGGIIGVLAINWITAPVIDSLDPVDLVFLRSVNVCAIGLSVVVGHKIGTER